MKVNLYTREGCGSCERVKSLLKSYNIDFTEHKVGINLTNERLKNLFPGAKHLPIIEEASGWAHSGVAEIEKMLNEYKEDFGKELLTEDSKFING